MRFRCFARQSISASTERRDRADKAQGYRRLPTLAEYVLIAQDVRRVEVYRRADGWEFERTIDADARSVRPQVPLADGAAPER